MYYCCITIQTFNPTFFNMRSIVSVSLPSGQARALKRRAVNFGFASLSEYFRFLVNLDEGLVSQQELLDAAREAERDYKANRLKKAGSLASLV